MTSVHLRDRKKFQVFSGCRSKYHKHLWLGSWPPSWPRLARKYSSPPSFGLSCGISTVFGNSLMDALYWHRNKTEVGKRERQESLKSWLAKPCCPDLASVDPRCFPQIEQEAVQIVIYGKNAYKPTKLVFMANEFTMCIWYCLLTILTLVLNHFYRLFLMSPHCELWYHKSGFV